MSEQKINKFVYWPPRILATIFILFLALFSLDIFDLELNWWQTITGLFMHNLPTLALLVILIISWNCEIVGGIAFLLAGFAYIAMLMMNQFEWYMLSWILTISGPAFLVGILFLINWFKKKK